MEVKISTKQLKLCTTALIWLLVLGPAHGTPGGFDGIRGEYLLKIVRSTKSSEMLNYLNVTSDPCVNFYDFACGNYERINPPNDFVVNNVFQDISESMYRKFLSVMVPNADTDTLTDMKVKNFYESCMNLGILRNTYRLKLWEIIGEFGHMPALEGNNWRDSYYFDWLKTVAAINRKYGKKIILGCDFKPDLKNKNVKTLYVMPQSIPLGNAAAYTEADQEKARNVRKLNIAFNLKHMLGLSSRAAEKTAQEIFDLESNLFAGHHGHSTDGAQTENFNESSVSLSFVTLDEMQQEYGAHIDIKRLVRLTYDHMPTTNVYNGIASSVQNIVDVVRQTPVRILANYIFYNLIEKFLLVRDPAAKNMENFMILATPQRKHQLQKVCIMETEKYFENILNNMVYRKYLKGKRDFNLSPLWETIKTSFRNILDSHSLTAMKEIYPAAVDKLQSTRLALRTYEETKFADEYQAITVGKHDYVENIKSILTFEVVKSRGNLSESSITYMMDKPVGRKPEYNAFENVITVPLSLLQPYYLWSPSYPKALQYATIGFLVARQLVRSLEFLAFDKSGNMDVAKIEETEKFIMHIAPCFELQYRTYYLKGRSLTKLESAWENIADSGGIQVAFNAYMQWYQSQQSQQIPKQSQQIPKQEQLPHLNYTTQQLFFIGFGQLLCSAGYDLTETGSDFAVEPYRVNEALANLEDFSHAFQCPKGTPMNPLTKCTIYGTP